MFDWVLNMPLIFMAPSADNKILAGSTKLKPD